MKPQKYAARRTTKENQMIATIGTGGGGVGPSGQGGGGGSNGGNGSGGGGGQMGMQPQSSSSMYDRDPRHTQVKTYTDHGNGHSLRSTGGPTQYSKVGLLICQLMYCSLCLCLLAYIKLTQSIDQKLHERPFNPPPHFALTLELRKELITHN